MRYGTGIPQGQPGYGYPMVLLQPDRARGGASRAMQPMGAYPAHMAGVALNTLERTEEIFKDFWSKIPDGVQDKLIELGAKALKLFLNIATKGQVNPSDRQLEFLVQVGVKKVTKDAEKKLDRLKGWLEKVANTQANEIDMLRGTNEFNELYEGIERAIPNQQAMQSQGGMPLPMGQPVQFPMQSVQFPVAAAGIQQAMQQQQMQQQQQWQTMQQHSQEVPDAPTGYMHQQWGGAAAAAIEQANASIAAAQAATSKIGKLSPEEREKHSLSPIQEEVLHPAQVMSQRLQARGQAFFNRTETDAQILQRQKEMNKHF